MIKDAAEREIKDQIRPIWLARQIIDGVAGRESVSFEDYLKEAFKSNDNTNPDEIENEFAPIIEAARRG